MGNGRFLFDLNRIIYSTHYNCTGMLENCYKSYIYCELCAEIMIDGNLPTGASAWACHVAHYHSQILAVTPLRFVKNLLIEVDSNDIINLDIRITPDVLAVFPQLLALSADRKLVYDVGPQYNEEEFLSIIFADIRGRNYSCKLCLMEYDSFPTLKLVHRHLRNCFAIGCAAGIEDPPLGSQSY